MLNFVKSLKKKLSKTQNQFVGKLAETIRLRGKVDDELLEELEEILIQADVGVDLSVDIIEKLRQHIRYHKTKETSEVEEAFQNYVPLIFLIALVFVFYCFNKKEIREWFSIDRRKMRIAIVIYLLVFISSGIRYFG